MRTKTVPASEIDPAKGLRASSYLHELGMFPKEDYLGLAFNNSNMSLGAQTNVRNVLQVVTAKCFATAVDHGWWEKYDKAPNKWVPEVVSSKICLMHSELSEALEEVRKRRDMGIKPYFSQGDQIIEVVSEGLRVGAKPEGMAAELADAVIRILDLAAWLNLDIAQAIEWKMAYNNGRAYKHGGKTI